MLFRSFILAICRAGILSSRLSGLRSTQNLQLFSASGALMFAFRATGTRLNPQGELAGSITSCFNHCLICASHCCFKCGGIGRSLHLTGFAPSTKSSFTGNLVKFPTSSSHRYSDPLCFVNRLTTCFFCSFFLWI